MSLFYKEFFYDFLLKVVCKNQLVEYKKLITEIFKYKREKWPSQSVGEVPM
jgi:hypothetical protein